MIDITALKQQRLQSFNQIMIIHEDGMLSQSCDAIFSTLQLRQTPIFKWFPFIESTFQVIKDRKLGEPDLVFPRIEHPAPFLEGYYDFSFSKIEDNGTIFILWSIYDFTALYKDLIQFQQERNQLEINRQLKHVSLNDMVSKLGQNVIQEASRHIHRQNMSDVLNEIFEHLPQLPSSFKPPHQADSTTLQGELIFFKQIIFNVLKTILPYTEQEEISIQYQVSKSTNQLSQLSISIVEEKTKGGLHKLKRWFDHPNTQEQIPDIYTDVIKNLFLINSFLVQNGGQLNIILSTPSMVKFSIQFPFQVAIVK